MYIALTEDQIALRDELREYFSRLMTEDLLAEMFSGSGGEGGSHYRQIVKQMADDGWLGLGWPKEYGGQARSMVDQLIFADEAQRASAPVPFLTLNTVGPTIMHFGSDEQKKRFLPGILKGDIHFSIGYTEPGAGTDLASLQTRAIRDGDEYIVNGQKVFTSLIEYADYVWLAVRTDPDVAKHKGISILITPTATPGFSFTPINTMGDAPTSSTYYEDVRVPVANLVAGENRGWELLTTQLNHERVALCNAGGVQALLDETRRWAHEHKGPDGQRVIDHEWVQLNLARVHAKVEFLKVMNWKVAWGLDKGISPADASATKVFASEFYCEAYRLLLEVFGPVGYVKDQSPGAVLRGKIERWYRATLIFTFGGGTNEIQRDIIAMLGLGMPRGN